MKTQIVIFLFLFFFKNSFSQEQKSFSPDWTGKNINQQTADSLIKLKQYYLINISDKVCDQRYLQCSNNIQDKYHVKLFDLQFMIFDKTASPDAFNQLMSEALEKINGIGWRTQFEKEVSKCAMEYCGNNDSVLKYVAFTGDRHICGMSFLYQDNVTALHETQKCIVDRMVIKFMNEDSRIELNLKGVCKTNKNHSEEKIFESRLKYLKEYVVSKGIDINRIKTEFGPIDNYDLSDQVEIILHAPK